MMAEQEDASPPVPVPEKLAWETPRIVASAISSDTEYYGNNDFVPS